MQLLSALITALVAVSCTVPIVSGAALPSDGAVVEARGNSTLAARAQGDEMIYIANCYRTSGFDDEFRGSYAPWYSNWRDSKDGEKPDSLTNEYRENGGTVTFEGREQVFTYPNGPTLYIHIQSNGLNVGNRNYAGYIDRNFNGAWTRFNCYRDNDRELFSWYYVGLQPHYLTCSDSLYYCAPA